LHCNDDEFYAQGLPIEYRASFMFMDLIKANYETKYDDDIQMEPKIVCIKNIH
jgi:hypothetical protein